MRQMPRPQPCLNRARGRREMNPVVKVLIDSESSSDSEQEDHSGHHPEDHQQDHQYAGRRNPCAHREHRTRIDMMLIVERRHERPMRMSEHAVDDVFEEGPSEESGNEKGN